jgi:hypothetical protein
MGRDGAMYFLFLEKISKRHWDIEGVGLQLDGGGTKRGKVVHHPEGLSRLDLWNAEQLTFLSM